ncbi:trigger factor [Aeromicrobium sp. Root495]|uniref:trigger factor n=1 Tax=Aeromicrobium sp. Root495 TaxID=1736550 RepID=UPI0006F30888|nr:trigger factor [Aeromicrobium sp. Root495]KQY58716.1 trigger factor [Aeromicrobium sp. Root495]
MKTTTESLSPTRLKLIIEVPFEDFQADLDKAYKSIGSQITVPGFRKGKVPAAIVDQRIGRGAVLDEAINAALPTWYTEALTENDIQPLSQPEIDLTKFADGEPIEVTAELDVRPEITLPDVAAIAVTVEDAEVSDSDVDEQLDALRERFATFVDVERAAAEGDAVTIDLSATDKAGEPIEGATAEGLPYTVGSGGMLEGLDEAVTGLSAGETTTFSTELVGGELKGEPVEVTVKVVDVKQRDLPELDEEFVQTASEFDTVDELKADVLERLTRGKRMEQAAEARDLVLDEIIGQVEAPLPEAVVAEELTQRRQQITEQLTYAGLTFEGYLEEEGQTEEEFEAELERRVRDSIVAQFVLDQVVTTNELQVEDAELSSHIIRRAQQSGQDPNSYIQHIMEHNHVPEMMSEVLRGKALASLVESAKVTDKSGNDLDLKSLQADGSLGSADDEA